MSPRLPQVRPRELIRAMERDGWRRVSQRGSHVKFEKDGDIVVVPVHNRDVRLGTLRSILSSAGISDERFLELLRS